MSFWDTVGEVAKEAAKWGSPLGIFDAARVAAQTQDSRDGDSVVENAKQFGSAFFKPQAELAGKVLGSAPVVNVMKPIAWLGNTVDRGAVAAVGGANALDAEGRNPFEIFTDRKAWDDAWNRAGAADAPNFGEYVVNSFSNDTSALSSDHNESAAGRNAATLGYNFASDAAEARQRFQENRDKAGFKIAAGALDIAATWYADPTIIGGKVAKASRLANRIVDGEQANEVFAAGEKLTAGGAVPKRGLADTAKETAQGLFSKDAAPEATYSRAYHAVAQTDGMDVSELAAHMAPTLKDTGDAAPIIGVMAQASKIDDLHLQRQVKMDTVLAAAGSSRARDRLMQAAPHIARAVQRVSLPPEEFAVVDNLVANGVRGEDFTRALEALDHVGNRKELEAYASELDKIHARMDAVAAVGDHGGLQTVGRTVLDRGKSAYRSTMQEFFYSPGEGGRTVRVVHWATGQRMKGVIATDDAVRGHDELMDTMKRSGLFTGDDMKTVADRWWSSPTQEARSSIAQVLPKIMLNKLAAKYELSDADLKLIQSQYKGWSDQARTYTTKQMEEARAAGKNRVLLNDPVSNTPTSVDLALFDSHIQNNVAVPDVQNLERIVRHRKDMETAGDKLAYQAQPFLNSLESANDIWRTLTLARPGFIVRTQLDTQARVMATMGATTAMMNAMRGLGHNLSHRLKPEDVQQLTQTAADDLRRQNLLADAADLRRQAQTAEAAGTSQSASRLHQRADIMEGEANRPAEHVATQGRIALDDRQVNLGQGVKVTTRSAADDGELAGLTAALHTGNASISDAMLSLTGALRGKLIERGGWSTVMPEDHRWTAAWLRSKDSILGSKAGKAIMDGLDLPNVDLMRHLAQNPEVKAAWREVRDQNPHFGQWLDRAVSQVEWTAPSVEVRDALRSGRVLKEQDVEKMFRPVGSAEGELSHLPERMPVHAPTLDVLDPSQNAVQSVFGFVRKAVEFMADQPDTVLGRVPFYTEAYFKHFQELGAREVARTGELGVEARAKIEKVARHRAIMDTRRTMYDTARFTGAHDRVARMGFAFIGAWEDSMRAWGRMFYDDPSRIGKVAKIWYAPDRGGLVVDEKGNRVRPGQNAQQKLIVLPVDWIPGVDFKEFRLRKDSFNSMFQGDVPWMPGFAPTIQVPVTQVVARTFPEFADPNFEIAGTKVGNNPILRQMFGFGLPKTGVTTGQQFGSVVDQLTPSWMRLIKNAMDGNSPQFSDAYGSALNAELLKAQSQGKDINSKAVLEHADRVARGTARSMLILQATASGGLGLSGTGATKADFYRQRYNEIAARGDELAKKGVSVQAEFLRQFPEAAGLRFSFSENKTGINATINVEDRARKYGKDIQKNPEYGWFYVGSDNVGGEFSSAAYSAQYGRETKPGSGEAWRSKMSPDEIKVAAAVEAGWTSYNKVKGMVDAELAKRGLHSTSQKGAEDLANAMKVFKDSMAKENPDWFKAYSNFDSSKLTTFINQVATPALSDGRLKNRSDVKVMGQYLQLRQEAMDYANSQGYSLGSNKAAPLRAALNAAGQQFAQQNIGFSQMWERMLQREVDTGEKDALIAATPSTAASSAWKFR